MSEIVRGAKVTRKSRALPADTNASASASAVSLASAGTAVSVASSAATSASPAVPAAAATAAALSPSPVSMPVMRAPAAAAAPGTRAWINGLTLCGTGVQQLDHLFGGGLPLSSLLLVLEDTSGVHARTFLSSFVAEGVGRGQRVMHVAADSQEQQRTWMADALPRNVTIEREMEKQADAAAEAAGTSTAPALLVDDDSFSQPSSSSGSDLKIAWRYTQYLERPQDAKANLGAHKQVGGASASSSTSSRTSSSSAPSATLSCSYDYHQSMSSALRQSAPPALISVTQDIVAKLPLEVDGTCEPEVRNRMVYRGILLSIAAFLDAHQCLPLAAGAVPSGPVCRVVLHSLGGIGWHTDAEHAVRPLLLFLSHLRQLLWSRRCVALLTVPPSLLPPSCVRLLSHSCHASISLSSFSDASGGAVQQVAAHALGDYDGLLRMDKAPTLHALQPALAVAGAVAAPDASTAGGAASSTSAASASSSSCFLYKCARRRILIEKFALPPEDEAVEEAAAAHTQARATNPAQAMQQEHAMRAAKPASVRSTRPPPAMSAAAAGGSSRGRIELGLEDDSLDVSEAGASLQGSSAGLSRRPGAVVEPVVDPRRAHAKAQNEALQGIVRGRASGCSGSHQLPEKMDF